jgi:hypothetical protein
MANPLTAGKRRRYIPEKVFDSGVRHRLCQPRIIPNRSGDPLTTST